MSYINYTNSGATRNRPISGRLEQALSFLPELGITMEVFSGGQPGIDEGGARVGSTRHDHGHAADVFFYKDGRKLDWNNPNDVPFFQEIVRRARANGVTGFGAGDGYMQPGSMHIGFGNEAVWGAGGKGENAANWLQTATMGTPVGNAPAGNALSQQEQQSDPLANKLALLEKFRPQANYLDPAAFMNTYRF